MAAEEDQALRSFALKSEQQRRKSGLKNALRLKNAQKCGAHKPEEDYSVAVV